MIRAILLATALLALPLHPVLAQVRAGDATFPEQVQAGGQTLVLAGTGVATYRVIFTVYGAALYVPPGTAPSDVLDARTPRRLDIEYFYEITPAQITEAANTILDRQLTPAQREAIDQRLRRFQSWFQTVTEGDRYRMEYLPGQGTTLYFNGERLGTIEGADFAAAYFGIWLADESLSQGLRNDLTMRLE
jgi:hypothetical protein